MMVNRNTLFGFFLCIGFVILLSASTNTFEIPNRCENQFQSDNPELARILQEAGGYCEKIKSLALFYVCREKILAKEYQYWVNSGRSTYALRHIDKNEYLYDFQLIRKKTKLKESRTLLEENGEKKLNKNTELNQIKYIGKYQIFGPVGFLSPFWQDFFHYTILQEENFLGQECIVIKAIPRQPRKNNYNLGRIWIDKRNFRILKIEWEPESILGYADETINTSVGGMKKRVIWSTEYNVETKGVRFPSRQSVREYYIDKKGRRLLRREIVHVYSGYRFFTVETDVDLKKRQFPR